LGYGTGYNLEDAEKGSGSRREDVETLRRIWELQQGFGYSQVRVFQSPRAWEVSI
jgi:hypothetical protein